LDQAALPHQHSRSGLLPVHHPRLLLLPLLLLLL
jgi:hypothetical protein